MINHGSDQYYVSFEEATPSKEPRIFALCSRIDKLGKVLIAGAGAGTVGFFRWMVC
ncbi:hypothetical protein F3Y22_tig00110044pilonHSYRG00273 [Hibiscus syriacus]|uniref:Uncharacterized protein n=1 Tax=Hibiscus syriacus TaxID=106335 RepID=A0A6A3BLY4_HIBSY|nr:hypothetical protein F3Y22_tig00110044pilonHSYRG00273 [Hibiscus syriacus]